MSYLHCTNILYARCSLSYDFIFMLTFAILPLSKHTLHRINLVSPAHLCIWLDLVNPILRDEP